MSPSAVFILGAGGFIGRRLAERIAGQGREVIAATRRATTFAHAGIRNVCADFDEASQFAPWLTRCGAVIHAASSSTPGSTAAEPQLEGNLRTTLALIEQLQIQTECRLLYLSSGGTLYGECEVPARECDPLRPRSYHGAGKAAAEHFIHAWACQYGAMATILRPSNVYGPGQFPRSGFGVIASAFDCLRRRRPFTVWGDGAMVRDYLFVDDLVALCLLALDRKPLRGTSIFNAASGDSVTLSALLDKIERVAGQSLVRVHSTARILDVRTVRLDAGAARASLGWTPTYSLDEGLELAWQWQSSLR